jgi:phosphatidylglycerol:prolipoprotein diacylglycerol transferase
MIALGFLASLYLAQRDGKKVGIEPQFVSNVAFWGLLLGIAGTRLLHIIMFPSYYSWRDPIGWIAIWNGGLVFQGALIGPIFYVWYALKKRNLSFWLGADLGIAYVPLAHASGRIGCFLNGCCYGSRTELPWALRFPRVPWDLSKTPEGSPPYLDHCQRYSELSIHSSHWSFSVHPTQLYGVAGLLALCLILLYLRKHWHPFLGFMLPTYFVLYSIGRFFVEFLRGDHNPTIGVFSEQQVFCIVSAMIGVVLFGVLYTYRKSRPPVPYPNF